MRTLLISLLLALGLLAHPAVSHAATWWTFQSIDTMKFSRDPSREALNEPNFKDTIDLQIKSIASTGANYVAIGTPYDTEFLPVLRLWVESARKYHLHIWFRGNWSGWEGWFGYPSMTQEQHLSQTTNFITKNSSLFADGDVFTACPECENGGPGDPRITKDVVGFRKFMISEYIQTQKAFTSVDKHVLTNYDSMNLDVAKLVMDPDTTRSLGGIVTVDHYVADPNRLANDLHDLARASGGHIILGEFGAPIPDIHGSMTPAQQATWLSDVLAALIKIPDVVGINYWTSFGGSTQLWSDAAEPRPAVPVLTSYYFPQTAHGVVYDVFGSPLSDITVTSSLRTVITDRLGNFQLPYLNPSDPLLISATGYQSQGYTYYSNQNNPSIYLLPVKEGLIFKLKKLTYRLFGFKIHS